MEAKQFQEIIERLDKLIRIVALTNTKDMTSSEKIMLLNRAGFGPKEIAEIIGTSQNVVNVRLSLMRKKEPKE
jgi:DNA-directed RNA polymerase specialized sigma24 family protein